MNILKYIAKTTIIGLFFWSLLTGVIYLIIQDIKYPLLFLASFISGVFIWELKKIFIDDYYGVF